MLAEEHAGTSAEPLRKEQRGDGQTRDAYQQYRQGIRRIRMKRAVERHHREKDTQNGRHGHEARHIGTGLGRNENGKRPLGLLMDRFHQERDSDDGDTGAGEQYRRWHIGPQQGDSHREHLRLRCQRRSADQQLQRGPAFDRRIAAQLGSHGEAGQRCCQCNATEYPRYPDIRSACIPIPACQNPDGDQQDPEPDQPAPHHFRHRLVVGSPEQPVQQNEPRGEICDLDTGSDGFEVQGCAAAGDFGEKAAPRNADDRQQQQLPAQEAAAASNEHVGKEQRMRASGSPVPQ